MIHRWRPLARAARLSAPLAAGVVLAACAATPEALRPSFPGRPEAFVERLAAGEAAVRTLRGRASIHYEGPAGSGSATQVIVVALPDRARVEVLSPFGTALLLLAIRGDDLTVSAPAQHTYGVGRATRETLGRLARIPLPPGPLLRLLAGLPPLRIAPGDPRVQLVVEPAAIRVESVDGPLWQRVWSGPDGATPERGELGEAKGSLLRFEFADRRLLAGTAFPFAVRLEEVTAGARLAVQYDTVRLNDPVEAGLFELPQPADGRTRILDLGAGPPP